jgi:hypothetical protein
MLSGNDGRPQGIGATFDINVLREGFIAAMVNHNGLMFNYGSRMNDGRP